MYLKRLSDLTSNLQGGAFLSFQHRPLSKRSVDLLVFGEYCITDHTVISNVTSGVFTLHAKMRLKL